MARDKGTLIKDPASEFDEKKSQAEAKTDGKKLDMGARLKDFQRVKPHLSKAVHPFDGYPYEYTKVNGVKICTAFMIAFDPKIQLVQDPSGENLSIIELGKDGKPTGKETVVTILSAHSRVVVDYERGGRNTIAIFDNVFETEDGVKLWYALVPSPSARAQIVFKVNKRTGKVEIDDRYLLLDGRQDGRLRRVMDNILKPARRAERDARAISGESNETLDDIHDAERPEGVAEG